MKNILLLTKTNIQRNRFAVLLSVIGAAMLCLILYSMGDMVADMTVAKVSIGVIDYDQSKLSTDFKGYLTEQLDYNILENYTYDEFSTELIDKNISVIIEIPEDFYEQYSTGNKKEITVTSLEDYENAAFLEVYINNYLSSISILTAGADGNQEIFDQLLEDYNNTDIKITQQAAQAIDRKEITGKEGFINSVGFYLMFIFAISVLISFMVLDDRLSGVFSRIQATPVKPIQYIIGTGVFGLFLCFLQIGLYIGYIRLMDIRTGIPLGVMMLMMSLFSLFTVSFSLAVSLAMKSKNAITSIIIGFSTVGCILGGAYFPLNLAPKSLQNIARVLPQYWFMDAFRSIQTDITANIYPNIIILMLYAVLTLLIGAVLFSQNYKNS
jgi:ABC-2 type transport system permease protein